MYSLRICWLKLYFFLIESETRTSHTQPILELVSVTSSFSFATFRSAIFFFEICIQNTCFSEWYQIHWLAEAPFGSPLSDYAQSNSKALILIAHEPVQGRPLGPK